MEELIQVAIIVLMMFLSTLFVPAHAGTPRCHLHGVLVDTSHGAAPATLADGIRLNFDADSQDKCERMMESYCYENVKAKGYTPTRLAGSFRPGQQGPEEFRYAFTQECKLQAE